MRHLTIALIAITFFALTACGGGGGSTRKTEEKLSLEQAPTATNPEGLKALGSVHPVGRIATPTEVARAALALTSPDLSFATGSTFWLDGGVLSRLHDPA